MAVSSGFFNSVNEDRVYNAVQFSQFFDGLICDGVYVNVGDAFHVAPGEGLSVNVGSGRAWFKRVWLYNDAVLNLVLDNADPVLKRIDAIVIDIDTSTNVRNGIIQIIKGTAATAPDKPTLIDTDTHTQYALAYITVNPAATSIANANIEDCQATGELPCVETLLNLSSYHLNQIDERFNSDENPTYAEAATLAAPTSGEAATTLYGKIKKLFTTLFAARSHTGNPKFLRHDLTYAEPPVVDATKNGYCPQRPVVADEKVDGNYKYLRADGNWVVPPNTENNNAVAQNSAQNANANLKVLLSQKVDAVNDVDSAKWDDDFRYNPSTNNLTVGTVNEVKLGKSGTKFGYYDAGGTFRAFKDPTGTASAGDVRSGKTFANAASDNIVVGTVADQGGITEHVNFAYNGSNLYIRIPKGIYTTNASGQNYPEICLTGKYKGTSQTVAGANCVRANDYYAINKLPSGYYDAEGTDWGPEIRRPYSQRGNTQLYKDGYTDGKAYARTSFAKGGELAWSGDSGSGQVTKFYGNGVGTYFIVITAAAAIGGSFGISRTGSGATLVSAISRRENYWGDSNKYVYYLIDMWKITSSGGYAQYTRTSSGGGSMGEGVEIKLNPS